MDLSLLVAFMLVQLAMSVIPGPAVLVTSSAALGGGLRDGIRAAAGVLSGNAVYVAVACAGVGALIASAPGALNAISLTGAAWLAWLAIKMFRASWRDVPSASEKDAAQCGLRQPYTSALTTQLSNPKSIVFFSAMLPQFVNPAGWPAPAQMAALGLVAVAIEGPVLLCYAWMAAAAGRAHRGRAVWLERGGAVVLLVAAFAAAAR